MQQATLARIVPDHLYLSRLVFPCGSWFHAINVYSMLAARDRDLLVQQRIEHIINATSDLENTFALDGRFSYHTCPLDDDPEEDLTPHLDPAHAIIGKVHVALDWGGKEFTQTNNRTGGERRKEGVGSLSGWAIAFSVDCDLLSHEEERNDSQRSISSRERTET